MVGRWPESWIPPEYLLDLRARVRLRHTLVDARVTWESMDSGWSMALYGTNLTDEEYFNGKLSLVTVLGREQGNIAPPRQWGLSIKRAF